MLSDALAAIRTLTTSTLPSQVACMRAVSPNCSVYDMHVWSIQTSYRVALAQRTEYKVQWPYSNNCNDDNHTVVTSSCISRLAPLSVSLLTILMWLDIEALITAVWSPWNVYQISISCVLTVVLLKEVSVRSMHLHDLGDWSQRLHVWALQQDEYGHHQQLHPALFAHPIKAYTNSNGVLGHF